MSILTNTTELEALLAKANALPDASESGSGSGGGSNIETCTVNAKNYTDTSCTMYYNIVDNGEVKAAWANISRQQETTLGNILKKSIVCVVGNSFVEYSVSNMSQLYCTKDYDVMLFTADGDSCSFTVSSELL